MKLHNSIPISLTGVLTLMLLMACQNHSESTNSQTPKKVIVDSDMVLSFDDGVAYLMMLGSPQTEVVGVTTVTGNTWAQEGLAYAIRQSEAVGASSVPHIGGASYPLRKNRLATFHAEVDANPGPDADWRGAVGRPEVTDWKSFYTSTFGEPTTYAATHCDASEFIAQQVLQHPDEVTLLAIGPCTNIANALLKHPEMASLTKEIVYMGGAVFCEGNITPQAESNIFYDPEAAAICLRAPFPRQTLVSLDLCNTVKMDYQQYFRIYDSLGEGLKAIFRQQYIYPRFKENPQFQSLVWDLISAAIVVDSSIITQYRDVRIDVDDNPSSPSYGNTFVTPDSTRQSLRIPLSLDCSRFWKIVESACRQAGGGAERPSEKVESRQRY